MTTLPRHSNIWYRSVLCIIITLTYRLYSFGLLKKKTIITFIHINYNLATNSQVIIGAL